MTESTVQRDDDRHEISTCATSSMSLPTMCAKTVFGVWHAEAGMSDTNEMYRVVRAQHLTHSFEEHSFKE